MTVRTLASTEPVWLGPMACDLVNDLLEMGAEARDPDLGYARGHAGLRHDGL